jgi:hypothetical protein
MICEIKGYDCLGATEKLPQNQPLLQFHSGIVFKMPLDRIQAEIVLPRCRLVWLRAESLRPTSYRIRVRWFTLCLA